MAHGENPQVRLIPIECSGSLSDSSIQLDDLAKGVCVATAFLYEVVGCVPPWLGYLAVSGDRVVGSCAFKGPPAYGKVEIGYFTFPEFENQDFATSMVRELVTLAKTAEPRITVTAQTPPEQNASTRILETLGFLQGRTVVHPDDGDVWVWELRPEST